MLISKDNSGRIIGWLETYYSDNETVTVNVHRNFSTVMKHDRTTGKVESKTFYGKPPLPSEFEANKK
jgi:hypothetical protein